MSSAALECCAITLPGKRSRAIYVESWRIALQWPKLPFFKIVDFWSERLYSSEQRATLEQLLFIAIALFVCGSTGIRKRTHFGWMKGIITVLSISLSLYLCLVLLSVVTGSRGYLMAALALAIGAPLALFPQVLLSRI